jgi:spermidine export protein MdtJ
MTATVLKIHYIWWLLLSSVFFAVGDFATKKWADSPNYPLGAVILVAYMLCSLAWLPAMLQKNELAVVGTVWSLLSMVATILLGTMYFKEVLTATQMVGIGFGLVACVLLNL